MIRAAPGESLRPGEMIVEQGLGMLTVTAIFRLREGQDQQTAQIGSPVVLAGLLSHGPGLDEIDGTR